MLIENIKWLGLFFVALMYIGAFLSRKQAESIALPKNLLFWIGIIGCIVVLAFCFFVDLFR